MLYILGGASRSGKSLISRQLVAQKQIPYFCIDFLITAFSEGAPELNIHHGQPFIEKAEKLWPKVKPMIIHILEDNPKYLIEGDGILPKQVNELKQAYSNDVRACFVGYPSISPDKKLQAVKAYNFRDDWTKDKSDESILKAIKSMVEYSQYLKEECTKYDIQYFDCSENFEDYLSKVVNFLITD